MELLATAIAALDLIFWTVGILVMFIFLAALVQGTIEDIRDHRRRVAARSASRLSPPPPHGMMRFGRR